MNRKLFIIALLVLFSACRQTQQQETSQNKNVAKDIPLYNKTPATSENKEPLFNPGIKNVPANIASFIPAGFSAIDTTSGDLNLDAYPDMILVLKNNQEDDSSEEQQDKQYKRQLLILAGQPDHTFKLVKKNDKAVASKDDGNDDDPFTGITIRNGYFSVEMGVAGGNQHWQQIVTFKYDKAKADWFLYKNGFISYRFNDSNDPNAEALVKDVEETKTVKDFGIVPFERYDIYKDDKN